MKNTNKLLLIMIATTVFVSCTKVIDIDLNSKDPQLIIEGKISNEAGPYTVLVSKSVNFSQSNNFPPVTNAKVIISDNSGVVDTLTQSKPGEYTTSKILGAIGKTYTLTVVADGKKYESTSKMPTFIPLDSLYVTTNPLNIGAKLKSITVPVLTDKEGEQNYFRFIEYNNGIKSNDLLLLDDKFFDGQKIENQLFIPEDKRKKNDSITVELICLDKPVYDYFLSVPIPGAAVFANPKSNISGGCLGYFSAFAVSRKKVVVE